MKLVFCKKSTNRDMRLQMYWPKAAHVVIVVARLVEYLS